MAKNQRFRGFHNLRGEDPGPEFKPNRRYHMKVPVKLRRVHKKTKHGYHIKSNGKIAKKMFPVSLKEASSPVLPKLPFLNRNILFLSNDKVRYSRSKLLPREESMDKIADQLATCERRKAVNEHRIISCEDEHTVRIKDIVVNDWDYGRKALKCVIAEFRLWYQIEKHEPRSKKRSIGKLSESVENETNAKRLKNDDILEMETQEIEVIELEKTPEPPVFQPTIVEESNVENLGAIGNDFQTRNGDTERPVLSSSENILSGENGKLDMAKQVVQFLDSNSTNVDNLKQKALREVPKDFNFTPRCGANCGQKFCPEINCFEVGRNQEYENCYEKHLVENQRKFGKGGLPKFIHRDKKKVFESKFLHSHVLTRPVNDCSLQKPINLEIPVFGHGNWPKTRVPDLQLEIRLKAVRCHDKDDENQGGEHESRSRWIIALTKDGMLSEKLNIELSLKAENTTTVQHFNPRNSKKVNRGRRDTGPDPQTRVLTNAHSKYVDNTFYGPELAMTISIDSRGPNNGFMRGAVGFPTFSEYLPLTVRLMADDMGCETVKLSWFVCPLCRLSVSRIECLVLHITNTHIHFTLHTAFMGTSGGVLELHRRSSYKLPSPWRRVMFESRAARVARESVRMDLVNNAFVLVARHTHRHLRVMKKVIGEKCLHHHTTGLQEVNILNQEHDPDLRPELYNWMRAFFHRQELCTSIQKDELFSIIYGSYT